MGLQRFAIMQTIRDTHEVPSWLDRCIIYEKSYVFVCIVISLCQSRVISQGHPTFLRLIGMIRTQKWKRTFRYYTVQSCTVSMSSMFFNHTRWLDQGERWLLFPRNQNPMEYARQKIWRERLLDSLQYFISLPGNLVGNIYNISIASSTDQSNRQALALVSSTISKTPSSWTYVRA